MVAAAPAALAAMVLVGGRSSSRGTDLRQGPDRNRTDTVGRRQEFAREQVHLDLAALMTAVIDDTVEADRRGFGGTGRIDVRDLASNRRRVRHVRFHAQRERLGRRPYRSAAAASVRCWWRAGGRQWSRIHAFNLSSS